MFLIAKYTIGDRLSKIIIYLFLAWWSTWLIISTLNVFELFDVSFNIYLLIMLGIFMFLIGFSFAYTKNNEKNIEIGRINEINIVNNRAFNIVLTICFIILLYYFSRYSYFASILPTSELRLLRYSVGTLFTSTTELLLFNYLIEAFIFSLYAVVAYLLLHGRIKNYTFILSLLCLAFYAGIGSGRFPIMYLFVAFIFVFLITRIKSSFNYSKEEFKMIKILKRGSLILAVMLPVLLIYASWLTAFRYGYTSFNFDAIMFGMNILLKQFIVYFTGPFRALEYGIVNYAVEQPYLYGRATLAGINEIAYALFHLLNISIGNINYILGDYLQNQVILVGNNIFFNYAYTHLMIFYFDLGIFGVIIFSFVYGFLARKTVFAFNRHPSILTLIVLVITFLSMIFSVFHWMFQAPSVIILITVCLVLHFIVRSKKDVSNIEINQSVEGDD